VNLQVPLKVGLKISFQPFEELQRQKVGQVVSKAVITSNGKLTDDFKYIADLRSAQDRIIIPGDFKAQKKVSFRDLLVKTFYEDLWILSQRLVLLGQDKMG